MQRWLYTAMTRGKKSVTVIDPTNAIEADGLSLDITVQTDFGQDAEETEAVKDSTVTNLADHKATVTVEDDHFNVISDYLAT
jgi:hypothetical protein